MTPRRVRRYPLDSRFLKKPCMHVEVGALNSSSKCVEVRASNLIHSNYKVCTKVRRCAFFVSHNVEGSTLASTQFDAVGFGWEGVDERSRRVQATLTYEVTK